MAKDVLLRGGWRLWPDVVLRGAGFPALGVLELDDGPIAKAADSLNLGAAQDGAKALDANEACYRNDFATSMAAASSRLVAIASSSRFREAVLWQNRTVAHTALQPYLLHSEGFRNARQKAREILICSYWQRYCVKNDSIGFFGPIGWARLTPDIEHVETTLGESLLDSRETFFENWTIDAVAAAISSLDPVRRRARPRRQPYVRIDGAVVQLPGMQPIDVPALERRVLLLCDGQATPGEIVTQLSEVAGATETTIFNVLDQLARRRLITWELEIPVSPEPEQSLKAILATITDDVVRRTCESDLQQLEEARSEVVKTAGDPDALDGSLQVLEGVFTRITGTTATRKAGKAYAGRTIVFEDCRRSVQVALGDSFITKLEPIRLILNGARWFTSEVARVVESRLLEVHRRTALSALDGRIDLASFWFASMDVLHGEGPSLVGAVETQFQAKWERVLALDSYEHKQVRRSSQALERVVHHEFGGCKAGWTGARYHSPDVLIAAQSADAARKGDYLLVLGELHPAINSLRHSCFIAQHPRPADLIAATDRDFPEPRLLPVLPKESPPRLTARLHPGLIRPKDLQVALFHYGIGVSGASVFNSSELSVDKEGAHLIVSVAGRQYPVLDVFSEVLMGLVLDRLDILPQARHTPRVTIDSLVVRRECWSFSADDLSFAVDRDESRRYRLARKFQQDHGLPQCVFVKFPVEDKPIFLSFDSPLLVNVLARLVRNMTTSSEGRGRIRVVEMLPDLSDTWLPDAEGNRYTCEFRLVAFDLGE